MTITSASSGSTTGSSTFDAELLYHRWSTGCRTLPVNDDLQASILETFSIPQTDDFVYHAIASVTLRQVQAVINHQDQSLFRNWYRCPDGQTPNLPQLVDVEAYIALFSPLSTPVKAMIAFKSNAKKSSVRAEVAEHLQQYRLCPESISISRCKSYVNVAYDFWAWSCRFLKWCGPVARAENLKSSHHILPIFMHHFGCVVPSYEALKLVELHSEQKVVIDIGSGNGYWAFMLRKHGIMVDAIDNAQSSWRTMWINDTIRMDGVTYLKRQKSARDAVLLLVYPIVGLNFTATVIDAFQGDTIIVAGTQNHNGYTAFKDTTIDDWMKTNRCEYRKCVQVPLPSFAGKDEALYIFKRNIRD